MQFAQKRPEDAGISPLNIINLLDRFEAEMQYVYGVMICKDGAVVSTAFSDPVCPDSYKHCYSLSKSFTSLAAGIVLEDGLIGMDDKVLDILRDEAPGDIDPRFEKMTVRNLLMMAASSATFSWNFATGPKELWLRKYFETTPYAEPGTEFHYDTGGYYALSCIISKVAGKSTHQILRERVSEPLEIKDTFWLEDAAGRSTGGWGLYMHIADQLKIAQLLLNKGRWDGRQLIPEWYVRQLGELQINTVNDPGLGWTYGYSYGFWIGEEGTFLGFGAAGQLLICNPAKNMAVITAAGCSHEQTRRLLDMIQQTIISPTINKPIPYDNEAYEILKTREKSMKLPVPQGEAGSGYETDFFGEYTVNDNTNGITFLSFKRRNSNTITVSMTVNGSACTFDAGYMEWITSKVPFAPEPNVLHSFAYAWAGDNELLLRHCPICESSDRTYYFTFGPQNVCFKVDIRLAPVENPEIMVGIKAF